MFITCKNTSPQTACVESDLCWPLLSTVLVYAVLLQRSWFLIPLQLSIKDSFLAKGETFCASSPLCWDFVWFDLVQILWRLSQTLWVPMCIFPVVSRKMLFPWSSLPSLSLTIFSPACSTEIPELSGKRCNMDIPARPECSREPQYLHISGGFLC